MPVYRDKKSGRFQFEFDREIVGVDGRKQRIRARKLLPKAWSQSQADAFDRKESARLYGLATEVERAPEPLIDDAVACYIRERVPGLKAGHEIVTELGLIAWCYVGKPMSKLAACCAGYQEKLASADRTLAPATIKKRIRYLTAAVRWAWKHKHMGNPDVDPGKRVVVPAVSNEKQVYIDRRQMLQIARKCQDRSARAAIRIGFYSGMRLGEIERAQRDMKNGAFVLVDTKNGRPRIVPMHRKVRVCAGIPQASRFVTGYHWRIARDAVEGMPDGLVFHSLRHSFASAMLAAGEDPYVVAQIMGHKSPASFRRYGHLAIGHMAASVNRLGGKPKLAVVPPLAYKLAA